MTVTKRIGMFCLACPILAVVAPSSAWGAAHRAYVSSQSTGTVNVIDVATGSGFASIDVGERAGDSVITPDGRHLYVSTGDAFTVVVIDTAFDTVVDSIPAFASPTGLAMRPDGARLYVTHQFADFVSVIDTATNTFVTQIMVGDLPLDAVVSLDGSKLYVANRTSGTISVVDTATNAVATTIVSSGDFPVALTLRPDGTRLYVSNNDGVVSVIDTATDTVVASIPVAAGPDSLIGIAAGVDGSAVYVADYLADAVRRIDTATNTVVATIAVGPLPAAIAVLPDGRLYVTDYQADTITVIDTATNTVTGSIAADPFPVAVTAATIPSFCGDGTVDANEECDDGNRVDGDCCNPTCAPEPVGYRCPTGNLCSPSSCDGGGHCVLGPQAPCLEGFARASLLVKEQAPGRESVLAKFSGGPLVVEGQFGYPMVPNGTAFALCIYDGGGTLIAGLDVDRAGERCNAGRADCWRPTGSLPFGGYRYKDTDAAADGALRVDLRGGPAGSSKILWKARNNQSRGQTALPTGITAALAGETAAAIELVNHNGYTKCMRAELDQVTNATATLFKAKSTTP